MQSKTKVLILKTQHSKLTTWPNSWKRLTTSENRNNAGELPSSFKNSHISKTTGTWKDKDDIQLYQRLDSETSVK